MLQYVAVCDSTLLLAVWEAYTRVPGLTIRDCVKGCNNCGQSRPMISAIDVTEKTFLERLYLFLELRKIAP